MVKAIHSHPWGKILCEKSVHICELWPILKPRQKTTNLLGIKNKNMENNLSLAFQDTLYDESIKDLTDEYLELGIDALTDNELIKTIPIIKTLNGLYKFTKSIREYYLTKKILRFLFQIKDIPKDEINQTLKKLANDEAYNKDFGENLVLLLDRFENVNKSDLLGQSFKMFLKEQLSFEDFLRSSHIIDKSFLNDLIKLKKIKAEIEIDIISKENLFSLGLLSLKPHEISVGITGGEMVKKLNEVEYIINDAGKLILKILEDN